MPDQDRLKQWQEWRASKDAQEAEVDVEKALYEALKAMRSIVFHEGYKGYEMALEMSSDAIELYESKGKL